VQSRYPYPDIVSSRVSPEPAQRADRDADHARAGAGVALLGNTPAGDVLAAVVFALGLADGLRRRLPARAARDSITTFAS